MKTLYVLAASALATLIAPAASAATVVPCSNSDIAPSAQACVGFESGDLLNSANVDAQTSALKQLGLDWTGAIVASISPLNGATSFSFGKTLMEGVSYIGVHYGNGQDGPGQGTAFYRFDAGTDLPTITLNYAASSNAVLYSTGAMAAAVPEPATWAMMLVGVGMMGFAMRRRQKNVTTTVAYAA